MRVSGVHGKIVPKIVRVPVVVRTVEHWLAWLTLRLGKYEGYLSARHKGSLDGRTLGASREWCK